MRVALFFDGKNFYSGWKDRAGNQTIDFPRLVSWVLGRVGGVVFTGAHYYTGVEPDVDPAAPNRLAGFLEMLEFQPGYFVHRFPRKKRSGRCKACGAENHYTTEKEVDTTMVADMLRLAAVGAFDVLVLMSGDSDHAPAVEGVRSLGKIAYVSTWGGSGLSTRLRKAAFDHIDLLGGLAEFSQVPGVPVIPVGAPPTQPATATTAVTQSSPAKVEARADDAGADAFLEELKRAEERFRPGYVGVNYFVTKWRSDRLDSAPIVRRRLLNRLADQGQIELYDAPNGERAVRKKQP